MARAGQLLIGITLQYIIIIITANQPYGFGYKLITDFKAKDVYNNQSPNIKISAPPSVPTVSAASAQTPDE